MTTDRLPRDAASLEHDARQAARLQIARHFDAAERDEREACQPQPVAKLTPSGRIHVAGESEDAWLTSRWAIGTGDAR